jgi:hypothetical protein
MRDPIPHTLYRHAGQEMVTGETEVASDACMQPTRNALHPARTPGDGEQPVRNVCACGEHDEV